MLVIIYDLNEKSVNKGRGGEEIVKLIDWGQWIAEGPANIAPIYL